MAFKDILKAVSPVAMIADSNPDMLRGLGLVGNIAANKLEDREERKRREAEMAGGKAPTVPAPGMKKGGKVSSASKRADGCAIKGKTKGRMV
jgi:hypothetical protein